MKIINKFDAIFFSPHLDDAVLSCGCLLARLKKEGKRVLVVTVFSQAQPKNIPVKTRSLVFRCGSLGPMSLFKKRRSEDVRAGNLIGFEIEHLNFIDAAYRLDKEGRIIYADYQKINNEREIKETELYERIRREIRLMVKGKLLKAGRVYFPLAIGRHIDHLIIREVGKGVKEAVFWEDFPYYQYWSNSGPFWKNNQEWKLKWIEDGAGEIELKKLAIDCYRSQIAMIFSWKEKYISNFERYFVRGREAEVRKIRWLTDELNGGAKKANDYMIGEILKQIGAQRLEIYEQVAPRFRGWLRGTSRWLWSTANFVSYLRMRVKIGDKVITTSPAAVMAWYFLAILRLAPETDLYLYLHGDRSYSNPRLYKSKKLWRYLYHLFYCFLYLQAEKLSIGVVKKMMVPSLGFKKAMKIKYGRRLKEIAVVEPGVDHRLFYPVKKAEREGIRQGLGIKADQRVVMYCGRADPLKGISELVTAAMGMKEMLKLWLVWPKIGSRDERIYRRRLMIKMNKSGLDYQLFVNAQQQELANLYRAADMVVLASIKENMPLVLGEALASGTIFLGTDTGGMAEVLGRINKGLIISRVSAKAIEQSLEQVWGWSQVKKNRIIRQGIVWAKTKDWGRSAAAILKTMADDD